MLFDFEDEYEHEFYEDDLDAKLNTLNRKSNNPHESESKIRN